MNLIPATYKVLYNNKNITRDVGEHLVGLTYTDKVSGEADELQLEMEDVDGLWLLDWYPTKKDILTVEIERMGQVLSCGQFSLDEINYTSGSGSGDVISISAVAAFFNKQIRTQKSTAHENKTLEEIARTVATHNGLQLQGTIPPIRIERLTQHKQTDLSFLNDLADKFGCVFSVRAGIMTFTDMYQLEALPSVTDIDRSQCLAISLKDKINETYKKVKVLSHKAKEKSLIDFEAEDDESGTLTAEDILEYRASVENKQQAERAGKAALHKKNTLEKTVAFTIEGNPFLVSGINFNLTGVGALSGRYHVTQSSHSLTRGDQYLTECEAKKVGNIPSSLYVSPSLPKTIFT